MSKPQNLTKLDGPYFVQNDDEDRPIAFYKDDDKLGPGPICNFAAWIDQELIYHDGPKTTTVLKISGRMLDRDGQPVELKQVTIDATELRSATWISRLWGIRPVLYPLANAAADFGTILQISSTPISTDVYTHTGWAEVRGKRAFLTMSGALQEDGLKTDVTVSLPAELQKYSLPNPKETTKADVFASLGLLKIGPTHAIWPAFLATYRSALGPSDFAIFIAGRTGTFKSELASLMQSHFGFAMNARSLPASWNSTANALEALAYKAKDCLMVVDDYVPVGTTYNLRSLEAKVDQVLRAQGNQAGRTRLSDTADVRGTMYPRGILLNTGEDIPTQHSIRGRMMTAELSPGDIPAGLLTTAQNNRQSYPKAMADWIAWLAERDNTALTQIKEIAAVYRDQSLGIGHSRTPSIIGDLLATAQLMMFWCNARSYLSGKQQDDFMTKATEAIRAAGENQKQYLTLADPVQIFLATIRQLLGTFKAHVRTKNGGVPEEAAKYGYVAKQSAGEITRWEASGSCLGWIDIEHNEFLYDPNTLAFIKKATDGKLAQTDQTFAKRLKDAGLLTRTEAARQRNTIRMTLDGHPRNVLAIKLDELWSDEQ